MNFSGEEDDDHHHHQDEPDSGRHARDEDEFGPRRMSHGRILKKQRSRRRGGISAVLDENDRPDSPHHILKKFSLSPSLSLSEKEERLSPFLSTHSVFKSFPLSSLPLLLEEFVLMEYSQNQIICTPESRDDSFYLIETGIATRSLSPSPLSQFSSPFPLSDMKEEKELLEPQEILSPGSSFGDLSLLQPASKPFTVQCRTDVSVWVLEGGVYRFLISQVNSACYEDMKAFLWDRSSLFAINELSQLSLLVDSSSLIDKKYGEEIKATVTDLHNQNTDHSHNNETLSPDDRDHSESCNIFFVMDGEVSEMESDMESASAVYSSGMCFGNGFKTSLFSSSASLSSDVTTISTNDDIDEEESSSSLSLSHSLSLSNTNCSSPRERERENTTSLFRPVMLGEVKRQNTRRFVCSSSLCRIVSISPSLFQTFPHMLSALQDAQHTGLDRRESSDSQGSIKSEQREMEREKEEEVETRKRSLSSISFGAGGSMFLA